MRTTRMYFTDIACRMLGVKELPRDLFDRLHRANELAEKVDGSIISRQIIAVIVMQWELDK